MSIWLFLFGCILIIVLVIAGSAFLIYNHRKTKCRVYPDPACYTDWLCATSTDVENVYETRTLAYLTDCGRDATDVSTTCTCVAPPDASIEDPNAANGDTTWSPSEANKSASVQLCA